MRIVLFDIVKRGLLLRHRGPEEWWSRNATIEDWFDEMVGVANIIKKYAAVRIGDIKGIRVFLILNIIFETRQVEEEKSKIYRLKEV